MRNSKNEKYNLKITHDGLKRLGYLVGDYQNKDGRTLPSDTSHTIAVSVYKLNKISDILQRQYDQFFEIKDAYDRGRDDLVKKNLKAYEEPLMTSNLKAIDKINNEMKYLGQIISLAGVPKKVGVTK